MNDLGFQKIPVEKIRPPKAPMREPYVDPKFVESVKKAILAAPIVNKLEGDEFGLIVGNRRLKAAREAGLESIVCKVVQASTDEIFRMTLDENLERENPNQMEVAAFISNYMDETKKSAREVAKEAGKNRSTVLNLVRVYKHPILSREVNEGHYSMPAAILLLSREPDEGKEKDHAKWEVFIDKHRDMSFHSLRGILEPEEKEISEKKASTPREETNSKEDEVKKLKIKKDEPVSYYGCDGCNEKFISAQLEPTKLCPRCREILGNARKDIAQYNTLHAVVDEKIDQKPLKSITAPMDQPPRSDLPKTPRKHRLDPPKNRTYGKYEIAV